MVNRLEEIGAAAAKEYSLEKALEKMKFEWKDQKFEFVAYRDTVSFALFLYDIHCLCFFSNIGHCGGSNLTIAQSLSK